jgi:hypothetical protein
MKFLAAEEVSSFEIFQRLYAVTKEHTHHPCSLNSVHIYGKVMKLQLLHQILSLIRTAAMSRPVF